MQNSLQNRGFVYLVGAGPGDPGLLTVRGAACLARADVVLYDYLVNPRILHHASGHALKICLGRHGSAVQGGDRLIPQEEVNRLMVEHASAGKLVVRLKGGDPAVFARVAEEISALDAAEISYEIVPGITAALAAGSHAGIAITHRTEASALAIVTGQEHCGKTESALDYAALAAFPGTLVFYMGVTTARSWSTALLAAGKPGDTPVAIVRRCSWPDQQTLVCTLADVADRMEAEKLRPPVIVLVGPAVAKARTENWFTQRPLFGKRVLVTRAAEQVDALADQLAERGADVIGHPVIQIGPAPDIAALDAAISQLHEFHWVVFSSANGVRAVAERLLATGCDMRAFGSARIAAIGPGTADELARFHLKADLLPNEYRAEALATELSATAAGKKFLLIRASRGREVLAESLRAAGGMVTQVVAYMSENVPSVQPEVLAELEAGKIDWVTVTSSAIARSLIELFGDRLKRCKLASISPITSDVLRANGYEPAAEATDYTMPGVVAAIVAHETQ